MGGGEMRMKKKILWILVSFLMVLSLIIASCGPGEEEEAKVTEEEGGQVVITKEKTEEKVVEEKVVEEKKEMVTDSLGRLVEKPEYGDVFTMYFAGSPLDWDEAFQPTWVCSGSRLLYEVLLQGDYTKGPTGTGEVSFQVNPFPFPSFMTGCLAESWEIVNDQTMRFNIRKGVHFHNKPPTNGREMTAYDIEYSLMRMATSPTSYNYKNYPLGRDVSTITALDKWTLEITCPPGMLSRAYSGYVGTQGWIVPHEAVEQYGDLRDWRNICGTGPFMITDYVPDTSITYAKHPNYWQKDPFHPENQLPYVDGAKILIIADKSTTLAAFRTGKIDQMANLWLEDKEPLEKTNPEILWGRYLPNYWTIGWRVDREPFDDLRVRKALSMAVDRQEILDSFLRGDGEILQTVCMNAPEFTHYFRPVEELSAAAQENYKYDPERARTLLAEAGYPNGFKTNIICVSAYVDMLSILKAYWDDIGVDLELKVLESGAWTGIYYSGAYDQMTTFGHNPNRPEMFIQFTWGQAMNFSKVNDPYINNLFVESAATLLTEPERNAEMVREGIDYVIAQAYSFTPPTPYNYIGWHPWVKQYTGEISIGSWAHYETWIKYLWIDQALKESMGY
jgi:peptide/nickel transport system substrate-binding protein